MMVYSQKWALEWYNCMSVCTSVVTNMPPKLHSTVPPLIFDNYVIYECSLRPRWMHAADSSGCPPRDPFSTISLSSLIPKRLEAVTSDQCRADPSSKMPAIAFWHTTFQFSFSPYGLPVISMTQLLTHILPGLPLGLQPTTSSLKSF